MKLLITGAMGHIGSRLIHSVRAGEFSEVVLVDNLATQRYATLFNLPGGVRFRFVEADVCNAELKALFSGMDAVVHLAAITNAAGSFEIQDQVERVNYAGTCRVAEACAATGARLIFPSTTSVYGTQQAVVDENCTREELQPQSPYAASKLRAEDFVLNAAGLRSVVCRLGTVYGTSTGMRFHTAINKFIWQACVGQPLTVWRTALHQQRPYLDLGDAVRAIRFILERDLFDNRVYNVLTSNATVEEVVELIRREVPDLAVHLVDSPIMNQLSYTVSDARFRALGFAYQGRMEAGVRETVAWLRNLRPH
jgi:UDP-glucose 4-epimerase